nr:uncharacterized protein LOC121501859 [Drosophila kikkawai]
MRSRQGCQANVSGYRGGEAALRQHTTGHNLAKRICYFQPDIPTGAPREIKGERVLLRFWSSFFTPNRPYCSLVLHKSRTQGLQQRRGQITAIPTRRHYWRPANGFGGLSGQKS